MRLQNSDSLIVASFPVSTPSFVGTCKKNYWQWGLGVRLVPLCKQALLCNTVPFIHVIVPLYHWGNLWQTVLFLHVAKTPLSSVVNCACTVVIPVAYTNMYLNHSQSASAHILIVPPITVQ